MKKLLLFCFALLIVQLCRAQETYPVNGAWDIRPGQYAFTNATIVVSAEQTITGGTLLVKDRTIEAVGAGVAVPKGYIVVDLKGKFIYPSLVDAFTSYGTPEAARAQFGAGGAAGGFGAGIRTSVTSNSKPGAFGWNEAIKPEMNVKAVFHADATAGAELKRTGFGAVQSIIRDGIARGTSAAVTLGDERDNLVMLNDRVAAQYSFSKGTAATNYPSSLMGSVALLRQSYLDAQWYKTQKEEYNISLDEFNKTQDLPQLFEVSDLPSVLRAAKIGNEFGKKYIYKTEGKEYQRIDAMKALNSTFIIPVTFPAPFDVEDPIDARSVSFEQLKDWELAPTNPAALEKAGIKFAITAYGSNSRDFWTNIRKAMEYGLTEKQALNSLTTIPAEMMGVGDKIGTLAKGKMANFIITSANLFKADNVIYENWIEGRQFVVAKMDISDVHGKFSLTGDGFAGTALTLSGTGAAYTATIDRSGTDSTRATGTFTRAGDIVSLYFDFRSKPAGTIRMSGYISQVSPLTFKGEAVMPDGTTSHWTATYTGAAPAGGFGGGGGFAGGGGRGGRGGGAPGGGGPPAGGGAPGGAPGGAGAPAGGAADAPKVTPAVGPVIYPFGAYGNAVVPKAETTLFTNATVWTNEKEGILINTDVLIEGGKIKGIGKNLKAPAGAKTVDGTGKHITAGIVDEHSHIAVTGGVNEGSQAVTAEVRIQDVLDAGDVNLYRQLAGGVTTSQILHGSANPIGGQNQIIKHRWGVLPSEMMFEGAPPFIKFALGENVKGSNNGGIQTNPRFPQTRMGVEEVYIDEFTRAKEYLAAKAVKGSNVRKDLELEAIGEILNNKRFITCHSYVQSEINMLIHVSDSMGFHINTFTHILEGYKVADKMKAHNIAGSTFSDWWAYKNEVAEAIPYNGKLMHEVGLVTGFNSDDEEMARRLNQEAGKAVTYGKMSEEDALKLVTLNPAKMLHVDDKVGSIKVGKDADVVVWSADPLSIYAVCEKTFVDGIPYWDLSKDADVQKAMKAESGRIIQKMIEAKSGGATVQRAGAGGGGRRPRYECETLEEDQFVINDDYVQGVMERAKLHAEQRAQNQ